AFLKTHRRRFSEWLQETFIADGAIAELTAVLSEVGRKTPEPEQRYRPAHLSLSLPNRPKPLPMEHPQNTCGTFRGLLVSIGPARSVVSAFVLFPDKLGLASKDQSVYVSAQSGRSAAW
ncbi:MAG TPA: hypothetical protein VL133_05430, partial [Devosia sp.]|nr:hypothetical protein [Devosia sp.]